MRRRFQDADRCVTASGLRPGQRVLEIGPGGGYVTEAILRRIGTGPLTCLDLQPAMLKQVRTRFAERAPALACGSGSVLPFRDQSFDVVLLVGVLGEIPDEDEALRECLRVLAPGGTLAVSECLPDPDYVVASALRQKARAAGFAVGERTDGVLGYTQRLERA
jgi:ubiquinone/menaquinone biosynthesis C-methylase UbiE